MKGGRAGPAQILRLGSAGPAWPGSARHYPRRSAGCDERMEAAQALGRRELRRYEHQTQAAGLSRLHGLWHQYAQTRYQELTGRAAPAAGGKTAAELTPEERAADRVAGL